MVTPSTALIILTSAFIGQSLAAAVPSGLQTRATGYPPSNPEGVTCYNTWETVTNDPVVQYWYVVVRNAGNSIKADRMWNHLNLNGCAPTENKYYVENSINGAALTFHTSEACTSARVAHAIRSSTSPPMNVACAFTPKEGPNPGEGVATAGDEALAQILEGLGESWGP